MYGALILSVAGIVSKILGACFRIPLGNMIGADGMGYYQGAYPIYILLLTVATAGIPVAISRMVAERLVYEDHFGARRVFKISIIIMSVLGILLFSAMFFSASFITSQLSGLKDAIYAIRAIAPALLFVPVMATFRGYFQGMQNMKPTAMSQVIEQLCRVICGLALAFVLIPQGNHYAAAGGTFGASAGAALGLVFMLILFISFVRKPENRKAAAESCLKFQGEKQSAGRITGQIFAIAVPITIGASIMPLLQNIDLAIVTNRLAASGAWTTEQIRGMYGQLTAFAAPLINMPFMVIQAITVSMVPTVVSAFRKQDTEFLHLNIVLGLRTALIVILPCVAGYMVLADPIMRLLYFNQQSDAVGAAPCLFILSIGMAFLASSQVLTAVLQGVGRQVTPVVNLFVGAVVKTIITFTLTGMPAFNVKGAAIGTISAYAVAAVLNLIAVKRTTKVSFDWKLILGRPLLAVLSMSIVVFCVNSLLALFTGALISTGMSILVGGLVYVAMIFVTGSVTKNELISFPKGETLVKIYEKVLTKHRVDGKM